MDDDSHSEIEVEPYEEIVNLNYSTPMANRASSPFCYEKDQLNNAQLHVPIVFSSESEVVSASTGLVASARHVARSEISMLTSRQLSRATVAAASGRKSRDISFRHISSNPPIMLRW